MKYDFSAIESKWQKKWDDAKIFCAEDHSEKPMLVSSALYQSPQMVQV